MHIHDYNKPYACTLGVSDFDIAQYSIIWKSVSNNINTDNRNIFSQTKREQMFNEMTSENTIYDCKVSGSYYSIYYDCNTIENYFSCLSKRRK